MDTIFGYDAQTVVIVGGLVALAVLAVRWWFRADDSGEELQRDALAAHSELSKVDAPSRKIMECIAIKDITGIFKYGRELIRALMAPDGVVEVYGPCTIKMLAYMAPHAKWGPALVNEINRLRRDGVLKLDATPQVDLRDVRQNGSNGAANGSSVEAAPAASK